MYIADGDYIKDIEVNDLRNRYTLTKGLTQKMVNTLVIPTDIPRHPILEILSHPSGFFVSFTFLSLWREFKLTWAHLAHHNPKLASADLPCVTSRSKKRLAPVR